MVELLVDVDKELQDAQERIRAAVERKRIADLEIEQLGRFISALETVKAVKAEGVQATPSQTLWGEASPLAPAMVGGRIPGNRSDKMPPRKPEFLNMPISQSAPIVLRRAGKPLHADAVVTEIYVIHSLQEMRRVKPNVVSDLLKLAKRGVVRTKGQNMYELA
ncbi:MAG: hypothetical protein JW384_03409 [Nitrosomonadaceae bacterium]|nr:hypothetical protein [Nitrosomonadaceae bacterium]